MTDHPRIWLEPECCAEPSVGRVWCQVNQWTCCPAGECDAPKPAEYVLASEVAALVAAARREGAEAMRDACARTAVSAPTNEPMGGPRTDLRSGIYAAIRALPLPGDET